MSNARPIAVVTFLAICLLSVFLTGGRYGYVALATAAAAGAGEPARGTFESVDAVSGVLRDRLPGLKKDRSEHPSAAGFDGERAQSPQAVWALVRFDRSPAMWPPCAERNVRAFALDGPPATGPPGV
jgi:hypothetical protein